MYGNIGVHRFQDGVYDLVSANAEDRRTQKPLCCGINERLHEALRFAFLDSARHARHRAGGDQRLAARCSDFSLAHPHAAERGIDVEAEVGTRHERPLVVERPLVHGPLDPP